MKNNNAVFATGAYQWALSQAGEAKKEAPIAIDIDLESVLKEMDRSGQTVKISIFEPTAALPPILNVLLLLEQVERDYVRRSFFSIEKDSYEAMKKAYPHYINFFRLNGRIRYQEELNAGRATPPVFFVLDD